MSHITAVKTHLKDGLVLRKALKKLGFQVEECDLRKSSKAIDLEFVARKGKVSIGFKGSRESKALYQMLADWEAMGTRREDLVHTIYQVYAHEKILDLARVRGYSLMQNRVNEKGQIEMVLRKLG
jgi:hypothetical protein